MEFEYDAPKSLSNREKHGVDFIDAQVIWEDPDSLEVPAKTEDEPRTLVIGKIQNKRWTAVITNGKNGIRIISVRRSRNEEVELYES